MMEKYLTMEELMINNDEFVIYYHDYLMVDTAELIINNEKK